MNRTKRSVCLFTDDICDTNPYSECRRVSGCPTAVEDIVSEGYLRICWFGVDEPIVCCRLQWIRLAFGIPWNSGDRLLPVPLFPQPYWNWNTFVGDSWSSPVYQPTDTRYQTQSPPPVTNTQPQALSSSVYYPSGTRDPSWSSPGSAPSNTRNPLWSPFQHVTHATQLPLRMPTKLDDTNVAGNLPTTPPPPPPPPRSKQLSQPKVTTQQTLSAYTTPPPIPGINNTISVQSKCLYQFL